MARTFLGNIYGQVNSEHQEGHNAVFPQWMPLYFLNLGSIFSGTSWTAVNSLSYQQPLPAGEDYTAIKSFNKKYGCTEQKIGDTLSRLRSETNDFCKNVKLRM